MALVRHKWISFGRHVYYLSLSMFSIFVVFLSEYLVNSTVPYSAKHVVENCEANGQTYNQ